MVPYLEFFCMIQLATPFCHDKNFNELFGTQFLMFLVYNVSSLLSSFHCNVRHVSVLKTAESCRIHTINFTIRHFPFLRSIYRNQDLQNESTSTHIFCSLQCSLDCNLWRSSTVLWKAFSLITFIHLNLKRKQQRFFCWRHKTFH